jgi:hypothetical protein
MQLNQAGFIVPKGAQRIDRRSFGTIVRTLRAVEWMSDMELACLPGGDVFIFDAEVYRNFFYVAFKHKRTGKYVAFEKSPAAELNTTALMQMFWRFLTVGFNSNGYDIPIITYACTGATNSQIKDASDRIIPPRGIKGMRPFDFAKFHKIRIPTYNTIDLIEVAPLSASLKCYMARIHAPRLQDLPIEPSASLTEEEAAIVRPYCCNDLDGTELLFDELAPQIKLREEMSREYDVDLRSKSDAQVAERVIASELKHITGRDPMKVETAPAFVTYKAPWIVSFTTPALQEVLRVLESAQFEISGNGKPLAPPELTPFKDVTRGKGKDAKGYPVKIGGNTYTIALGGLHSCEQCVSYYADDETVIEDTDVVSYYPKILLNSGMFPIQLGPEFRQVYESIVNRRLEAKKDEKRKREADSLKITINGVFGKLGNRYSIMYAPDLLLFVTITGQLLLLMLIEALENVGIHVVSANTDGVVAKFPKARRAEFDAIVKAWREHTQFETESTEYASMHNRDVNNYYAVKKKDGTIKTKGAFSEVGSALNSRLSKNAEFYICSKAVQEFITKKTPLEKTIAECQDIRQFVAVKNVKGGGQKGGIYLGKVVRWYYARNEPGCISYIESGNKVPKTDGAKPLMDLPTCIPDDLNRQWYVDEAYAILGEIGVVKKLRTMELELSYA